MVQLHRICYLTNNFRIFDSEPLKHLLYVHALPSPNQLSSGILIGYLSPAVLPVLPMPQINPRVPAVLVYDLARGSRRVVTPLVVVVSISGGLGDPSTPAPSEEPRMLDDGAMLVHEGLVGFVLQVQVGLLRGFVPDLEGLL